MAVVAMAVLSAADGTQGEQPESHGRELRWGRPTTPPGASVQHRLTLAQSTAPTSPTAESSVSVLRWRTPGVVRATISSVDATPVTDIITLSAVHRSSGSVRQVSVDSSEIPYVEADSVRNPLDRREQQLAAPRELPELVGPKPLPAPLHSQENAAGPAPILTSAWQDDLAPEPQSIPAPQVLPEPQSRGTGEALDAAGPEACDRIYNERDCCADEQGCNLAREYVQRDSLAKITLDITPQLRPDVTDPYSEESERNADLARAPIRTWRDRSGNVVAVGRLNLLERRRLLVLTADNQIARIRLGDLSDDDLCFLSAWWRVPTECTLGDELYEGRSWQPMTMTWKATGVCHKPLYFEEVQLERYGHTLGHFGQPLASGAHFFVNLVTLPYQAGINPPWECRHPLGYYRPGSCAPWLVPPIPLSVRGALWQAGAVVGGVAIIP